MKQIIKNTTTTYEINKSIFITYLRIVKSVDEAKEVIKEIKAQHKDATHHISCYSIGDGGEISHTTDDGEPSGTAGLPTLEVFRKNDVTNFVCVTVRYFGGIKLGAGGLIRAYSTSASLALKDAGTIDIIKKTKLILTFNYSYLNEISKLINKYEIINKDFSSLVKLTINLPENDVNELKEALINLTNNQVGIEYE